MVAALAAFGALTLTAAPDGPVTHKVESGETLYGISKKYGVSIDRIIELNPTVRDGVKAGSVLTIVAAGNDDAPVVKTPAPGETRTIRQGETLYRISKEYGITVDDLLRANPDIDALNYQAGAVLVIPQKDAAEQPAAQKQPDKAPVAADPYAPLPENPERIPDEALTPDNYSNAEADDLFRFEQPERGESAAVSLRDNYNVAVVLPFMLKDESLSTATANYLDFYRGFLLAADRLKDSGAKVNIMVYDTSADSDSLASILRKPEFSSMDAVIVPNDEAQLNYIAANVDQTKTFVMNPFVTRNAAYRNNGHVVQFNIPLDQLQDKAINAFMAELAGRTPVFLSRNGSSADKSEFVRDFKKALDEASIPYEHINFDATLAADDLASLSNDAAYVFMPTSSGKTDFSKISEALIQFKSASTKGADIVVFGYPEWLTFRGEPFDEMNKLDAVIYSRFYEDPTNPENMRVKNAYASSYGREMLESVPSMALLGFDTGMFVIGGLRVNGGDFHTNHADYSGVQNSFRLDDSGISGLVNTSALLVKFKEGISPEVVTL